MKHLLLLAGLLHLGVKASSRFEVANSRRALMEGGELNEEELNLIINKTAKPGYEPGQY